MSQAKRSRSLEQGSVSITTPSSPRPLLSPRPRVSEVETSQSPLPPSRRQESGTITRISAPDHISGFLSSTSFPAIVKENFVETLGPLPSSLETGDLAKHNITPGAQHMTSEQVEGIRILRQLPNRQTCEALVKRYTECDEFSFHRPTTVHIASSIWSTFGQYLEEPRHLHGLELVVQEIIHNSSKPLEEPDDYHEWIAAFSGPTLRWEALGIVLISMAHSCMCLAEIVETTRLQVGTRRPTKDFSIELKGCVEAIIDILRKNESINPLVSILSILFLTSIEIELSSGE